MALELREKDSDVRSRISGRTPKQKCLRVWRRSDSMKLGFCIHEIDFDGAVVVVIVVVALLSSTTLFIFEILAGFSSCSAYLSTRFNLFASLPLIYIHFSML